MQIRLLAPSKSFFPSHQPRPPPAPPPAPPPTTSRGEGSPGAQRGLEVGRAPEDSWAGRARGSVCQRASW